MSSSVHGACAALVAAALLGGCSLPHSGGYDNEDFTAGSGFSHIFPGSGPATCEAARRALLSQGYLVNDSKPTFVKGSKNFQRDNGSHAEIEFSVICAADAEGSNTTTAFANAVRALYTLKKSSNSASVGVGVLGSLSLPLGLSDDSLVRVGAETISSKKFYDQFFAELERYLGDPDTDPDPAPQATMTPPYVPPEPVIPVPSAATAQRQTPAPIMPGAPASVGPVAAPPAASGAAVAAVPTAPATSSTPAASTTSAASKAPASSSTPAASTTPATATTPKTAPPGSLPGPS